jgi:type I restriction enzyme S subunit
MQRAMPKGWKKIELKNCLKIVNGYAFDSKKFSKKEGTPLVRIRDLKTNYPSVNYNGSFDKKYIVTKGDFLIGMDGEFRCYEWQGNKALLNQRVCKLSNFDIDQVNPKYIFLNINKYLLEIENKTHFVTVKHISSSQIKNVPIPLPPLPVQHKIVGILEEADNLRKLRHQADEKMKDLIPSFFVEMFGSPATNPKGWEVTELSNLANFKRGPFGGSLKKEIFVNSGYKVYEQKNAIYNDFELGSYFITQEKYNDMIGFSIAPNDLIISCSGTMGKVAIVPKSIQPGVINQALLKITPNFKATTSLFLKLLIESETIQRKYFKNTAGSAIQNVASVGTLKKIKTSLPPLPLQKEFAKLVEEIEAEKARQAESKKKLDDLFNSLMKRAFKGELVA